MLFTILASYIFFEIFFGKGRSYERNYTLFGLLGLVSGVGIYFCYTFMITLAVCLIFWFLFDKHFLLKKGFFTFVIFFILGLSPLLFYNLQFNFSGLEIHGKPVFRHFSFLNFPQRASSFLFSYLPNGFYSMDTDKLWGSRISSAIFFIIFSYSFFGLIWMNRGFLGIRKTNLSQRIYSNPDLKEFLKERFIWFFPVIFFFAYSFSDFKSSSSEDTTKYKYLFPILPFCFVVISLFVYRFIKKIHRPCERIAFVSISVVLPVILSLISIIKIISFDNFTKHISRYKGYSHYLMGCNVVKFIGSGDVARMIRFVDKIEKKYRGYAYRGFGNDLALRYSAQDYLKFLGYINKDSRDDFYRGIGFGVAERSRFVKENFSSDLSEIEKINPVYQPYCFEGVGILSGELYGEDFFRGIKEIYLPYYYRGLGIGLLWRYRIDMVKAFDLADKIDPRYRKFYRQGLKSGINFEEYYSFDIDKFEKLYNLKFQNE
jgi:hypothetical protein